MKYEELVKKLNELFENASFMIEEYSKETGEDIEDNEYLNEVHTFANEILTGLRG